MSRQGLRWKAKLKFKIDRVIKSSVDFSDFLRKCANFGVLVEYDRDYKIDLKFMLAEQKERNPRARFPRSRTVLQKQDTLSLSCQQTQEVLQLLAIPELAMPGSRKVITVYNSRSVVWTDYEETKSHYTIPTRQEFIALPFVGNLLCCAFLSCTLSHVSAGTSPS